MRSDGVLVTNYHVITIPKTSRLYDEIFLSLSGDGDTASSPARYRLKPLLISKESISRCCALYRTPPVILFRILYLSKYRDG